MAEGIRLREVSLDGTSPALSMFVRPGESVAIVGPAGSGKTRWLRILAGLDKPPLGKAALTGSAAVPQSAPAKETPQSIARGQAGANKAARASEALSALKLWDVRQRTVSDLSPSQAAACELIPLLTASSEVLAIDGHLDRLDPWALKSVLQTLQDRLHHGAALVIGTNRPDLVAWCDLVLVLKEGEPRYAGKVSALLSKEPQEFQVTSESQAGVRALVEPLGIGIESSGGKTTFRADGGQELAARLLLEGYGNVRMVVTTPPSIEEALLDLF